MLGVVGVPGFGAANAREVSDISRAIADFIVSGFKAPSRESKLNKLGRQAANTRPQLRELQKIQLSIPNLVSISCLYVPEKNSWPQSPHESTVL
jgi:hypothetical protein